MKKNSEKRPIDDLFARKLGNMSIPPNSDGFERLQARMIHRQPQTRVVFWRSPNVYKYSTAAACLILIGLFGWQYWLSGAEQSVDTTRVASNHSRRKVQKETSGQWNGQAKDSGAGLNTPDVILPESIEELTDRQQVAGVNKPTNNTRKTRSFAKESVPIEHFIAQNSIKLAKRLVNLAATKSAEGNAKLAVETATLPAVSPKRVVDNSTKPAVSVERVLIVTIAEPEALVAARQAAKTTVEQKPVVATTDKPEKEAKTNTLWQQVKRIKQGEVFARGDNNDAERGLLSRAYSGLKHNFDKDKAAKQ